VSSPEIRTLDLARLKQGFPGVSPVLGAAHLEACLICLEHQKHRSGVLLSVKGDTETQFRLQWEEDVTPQMRRSWEDMENATEWAACGLAFLLIAALTPYTIIRQAQRGTRIDYWVGEAKENYFQEKARLEVSGIRAAKTESQVRVRVTEKWKRITKIRNARLPVYIIVVEFSRPLAYMEKHDGTSKR
jgi:hypothetical protein